MNNLTIEEIIAARQQAIEQLNQDRAEILAGVGLIQAEAIRQYEAIQARVRQVDEQLDKLGVTEERAPIPALRIEAGDGDHA